MACSGCQKHVIGSIGQWRMMAHKFMDLSIGRWHGERKYSSAEPNQKKSGKGGQHFGGSQPEL